MRERVGIAVSVVVGFLVLWMKVRGLPGEWVLPAVYLALVLVRDGRRRRLTGPRLALYLLVAAALGAAFAFVPAYGDGWR